MKPFHRRKPQPARSQPTPDELLERLLSFLQRKFYQAHAVSFAKDRPRLLKWVVLWPAKWFNDRAVTITPDRYAEIFYQVFLDAQIHGAEKVTYLPAWLSKVIQSHFHHHGEEYYEQAKSIRNAVETAMIIAGHAAPAAADPIRELATAARLLKPKPRPQKPAVKDQLTLL